MIRTTRKILYISLGSILVMIGLFGLVLPIINGTVLLIIGFIILSFESVYVERHLHAVTKKNDRVHQLHLFLEKKIRRLFGK